MLCVSLSVNSLIWWSILWFKTFLLWRLVGLSESVENGCWSLLNSSWPHWWFEKFTCLAMHRKHCHACLNENLPRPLRKFSSRDPSFMHKETTKIPPKMSRSVAVSSNYFSSAHQCHLSRKKWDRKKSPLGHLRTWVGDLFMVIWCHAATTRSVSVMTSLWTFSRASWACAESIDSIWPAKSQPLSMAMG